MKLIFLDLDGVLNSREAHKAIRFITGKWVPIGPPKLDPGEEFTRENLNWAAMAVYNLRSIVDETGASIVISSKWATAYHYSHQYIDMFRAYNWQDAPIIGVAGTDMSNRGADIQEWIRAYSRHNEAVDNYVILDDNADFSDIQKEMHLVCVDGVYGLRKEDADKAIMILGK